MPAHLPEEKDERWVTVFGAPSLALSRHYLTLRVYAARARARAGLHALLRRGARHALPIRECQQDARLVHLFESLSWFLMSPISFGDKFQAKTALRKNGEELTETLMIGVVPYKDTPLKKRPHEGEPAKRDIHKGAARAVHAAGNKCAPPCLALPHARCQGVQRGASPAPRPIAHLFVLAHAQRVRAWLLREHGDCTVDAVTVIIMLSAL